MGLYEVVYEVYEVYGEGRVIIEVNMSDLHNKKLNNQEAFLLLYLNYCY